MNLVIRNTVVYKIHINTSVNFRKVWLATTEQTFRLILDLERPRLRVTNIIIDATSKFTDFKSLHDFCYLLQDG
jgi:hypothetical protein